MRTSIRHLIALALLAGSSLAGSVARADDNMFPPAPAAKGAIDFDGRGFIICGRRTFIASGSLHYPRAPHEQWRSIMERMKAGGFNTVQTYVFWNFQETKEGAWDFSGDHDLDLFLKTAQDVGLYATVRVGPYVCAEWNKGGWPEWLAFKPGVKVRENDPAFLSYMDKYYETVVPMIAAHQIHKGGNVILFQVENEDPRGWGTDLDKQGYHQHLLEKVRSLGMEVPTFFSGVHHGSDPAGGKSWDSVGRKTPWYTTELWCGWYNKYGTQGTFESPNELARPEWKITAFGGNGYNLYMAFGGTNFGFWNSNEDASTYDYAAPIGQTRDLRPEYYAVKRTNWFSRTFQDILENSRNADAQYKQFAGDAPLHVTARTGPAGTIVFLDNPRGQAVTTRLQTGQQVTVQPGNVYPIVASARLTPEIKIAQCTARVLGAARAGAVTTLVVFGDAGNEGEMQVGGEAVKFKYPAGAQPEEKTIRSGPATLRLLVMNRDTADRTWFIDGKDGQLVAVGPDYISHTDDADGKLKFTIEQRLTSPTLEEVLVYDGGPQPRKLKVAPPAATELATPTLSPWESSRWDAPIAPAFDDASWRATGTPAVMSSDGDPSPYAWYRTTATFSAAGTYVLDCDAPADRYEIFVNGQRAGRIDQATHDVNATFKQGPNAVAILATHDGYDKLFGYSGDLQRKNMKGIISPLQVFDAGAADIAVENWKYKLVQKDKPKAKPQVAGPVDLNDGSWKDSDSKSDVFDGKPGFAWFHSDLPAAPGDNHEIVFDNVDDKATVYFNGKRVGQHDGFGQRFTVNAGHDWRAAGPNRMDLLVENSDGAGGIMGPVRLFSHTRVPGTEHAFENWKLRGGVPAVESLSNWQPVGDATGGGVPTFYRSTFSTTPPTDGPGPHPVWRISTAGMSHGFIWLNGHNLGRAPDFVQRAGLYLPECWVQNGQNTLVVLDEDGNAPTKMKIIVEAAASREVTTAEETK